MNTVAIASPSYKELNSYISWLSKRNIPYRILKYDDHLQFNDILLLCGGCDYGKNIDRDIREIAWVKQALFLSLKIVGICRGLQIINIVLGGTLINDIQSKLEHRKKDFNNSNYHNVKFIKNHYMNSFVVNTRHHQAINKLAENLNIDAIADDNIIEAVSNNNNIKLVQWHPELEEVYNTQCELYVSNWIINNLNN